MGTPAIITINDGKVTRMSKYCDGYPTVTLSAVADTIEALTFESGDLDTILDRKELTSHIMELQKGFRVEEEELKKSDNCLGNCCDIEWVYRVNLVDKTVRIYGGKGGMLPIEITSSGPTMPMVYSKGVKDEYKKFYYHKDLSTVLKFIALGWSVNGKTTIEEVI